MTSPPKTSPGHAADQLAFAARDRSKYYWVDELGTLRAEKLWWLVDAVKELRADLSRRLEELYLRTRVIPNILKRLDALEGREPKKKP